MSKAVDRELSSVLQDLVSGLVPQFMIKVRSLVGYHSHNYSYTSQQNDQSAVNHDIGEC